MKDKTFTPSEIASANRRSNVGQFESYEPEWLKMSDIEPKTQPWFWPGMIPLDSITLFGGVGGIGKSLLLLYLLAKTTTGEEFMAGGISHQLPQGSAILLSAEDDAEYHIMPKLIAAGAKTDFIHLIKSKKGAISKQQKFLELDKDIYILESKIKALENVKFIVIDPITYFTGDTQDHKGGDVANFLQSLNDLAKRYHLSIVLSKHRRKQSSGSRGAIGAADEIGGSGAWTNTPRRCWMITNHHEDDSIKLITKMKDNLSSSDKEALGFKILPKTIEYKDAFIETTELIWLQEKQRITADEAVNKETYEKSKYEQAIDFFFNYLKEKGQARYASIKDAAIASGISLRTMERAHDVIKEKLMHKLIKTSGIKGAIIYQLRDEE